MRIDRNGFWRDAITLRGSITPRILPNVVGVGLASAVICSISWMIGRVFHFQFDLEVAPFEMAGAALGLLLIMRTNSGYDRWWEARKAWGGIVNQTRNLVISALSFGPADRNWRTNFVRWTAVFPHAARCSLRGSDIEPDVRSLIGHRDAESVAKSKHMPSFVSMKIGSLLREACEKYGMDRYTFLQLDRERAALIDHIGACERILKSPLPIVLGIKIRQFIAMFLLSLPLPLMHQIDRDWLIPYIVMLVSYPLFSLDQIGVELQNPFSKSNLGHLPLCDISDAIEEDLLRLLEAQEQSPEAFEQKVACQSELIESMTAWADRPSDSDKALSV